jgi:hypothetical protein
LLAKGRVQNERVFSQEFKMPETIAGINNSRGVERKRLVLTTGVAAIRVAA